MEKGKDKKNSTIALLFTCKSPPQCIVNIEEFVKQARQYAHLVTPDGFIINSPDLEAVEKRITCLLLTKKLNKTIKSNKDYVMKMLAEFGVKIQQIVKGKDFLYGNTVVPISQTT